MANPGRISSSKITTYEGCSLAYFLQYVKHEVVPTPLHLVFGKDMHYMSNRFYGVNFKSADSFVAFWKHHWDSTIAGDYLKGKAKERLGVTEYMLKNGFVVRLGNHISIFGDPLGAFFGYRKLGEAILRRFYERHKSKPPPVDRERRFGLKKDDVIEIGEYPITGVFDRIDKRVVDGREEWFITDYKTDKASPENNAFVLHRIPQFTLYSYAFRKIFGVDERAILYYHLRSGKIFETHRSQRDYDYLSTLVGKVVDGIIQDRFIPFYGFHCNFCAYQVPCEGWSVEYGGPSIIGGRQRKIKGAKEFTGWDIPDTLPSWMEIGEGN